MIRESKQTIHYICFLFSGYYVRIALLIWSKNRQELCLIALSVLLKIRFGHAQISVPKIGIAMWKTGGINPLHLLSWRILQIPRSY